MDATSAVPKQIDLLIVGGGTAGAALAGIIARDSDRNVVLLEAGPDYGPFTGGRWPREMLDARRFGLTHDWGYAGLLGPEHTTPRPFERGRILGGSSSHNGCIARLGHRRDYDRWAELGNDGWNWESVAPAFDRAVRAMRVRQPEDAEATPFQEAFIHAAYRSGIPRVADLNDPDDVSGVGLAPVNIDHGVRWNAAFAYLDPVRERPNLRIIGDTLVDRVELQSGRAVAVEAIIDGLRLRIPAERIVLAGGAYGSPAILLRSGIGPADELSALGITPLHPLPGVGRRLTDHVTIPLLYRGRDELDHAMDDFEATCWLPDEQALGKTRSSRCDEAFDLHLYTLSRRDAEGRWFYHLAAANMAPHSHGSVKLTSSDPLAPLAIDHGYLTDPDDEDLAVLADGLEIVQEIVATSPLAKLLGDELRAGANPISRADAPAFIRRHLGIDYHPACTCRMGPAGDETAVVDSTGKLHGLDNLYLCDASIFPTLMRANTNLPAAMVAEKLAGVIGGDGVGGM
jgi:choline dehydrogenase